LKLKLHYSNSRKSVAPVVFVVIFVLLVAVAFFTYIFGTADKQIISQDNSYASGALNTPEFNYMSAVIALVPAIGLFVGLIYVIIKSQQRSPDQ